MNATNRKIGYSGKPYGHVPGHTYHDVECVVTPHRVKFTVTWGSAQGRGCDEEHRRVTIVRPTIGEAIRALLDADETESVPYAESAYAAAMEDGR